MCAESFLDLVLQLELGMGWQQNSLEQNAVVDILFLQGLAEYSISKRTCRVRA